MFRLRPFLLRAGVAGGFLPSDVSGLVAWWRYNTGLTENHISDQISQWDDQSGNDYHLICQSPNFTAPTGFGQGWPYFEESGVSTSDALDTDTAFPGLSQPYTIYILEKHISFVVNGRIFNSENGSTLVLRNAQGEAGGEISWAMYAGSSFFPSADLTVGEWEAVAMVYNGSSSVWQVGSAGTPETGDAGTSALDTKFCLAARNATPSIGNPCDVEVKEALIYSGAHDVATITTILEYLESLV